ncbi:MAG: hypothetical protein KAI66_06690, partial [Lentisphaeria bacterium]|nr:hypothetical protein [Lentisphaeria bacterium]
LNCQQNTEENAGSVLKGDGYNVASVRPRCKAVTGVGACVSFVGVFRIATPEDRAAVHCVVGKWRGTAQSAISALKTHVLAGLPSPSYSWHFGGR